MRHILKSLEFASVLKSGRKLKGKTLSAHIKQPTEGNDLAVGCIISKKVAPQAVKRNYIRRLIYAYFRENERFLKEGAEIVIRLEKNISGQKKKAISREIREELKSLTEKMEKG